jgi:hypothetical protein
LRRSAAVASIVATVLSSVDAMRNDGSRADDRCSAGDGSADNSGTSYACSPQRHLKRLLR